MQGASLHHDFGFEAPNESRVRIGWVLGALAAAPLVLSAILAFDFAMNDYVDDEALFMRVLIGFFASIAVFVGLLATALIRSGRSGSQIDQVFFVGVVLAVLGALVGLTFPGGAGMTAFVVGGVGMLLMGIGAVRS